MERIYRILKIVEGRELEGKPPALCREFGEEWLATVDECLEKDYVARKRDGLMLTKHGADFIGLYEEILELLPRNFCLSY